MITGAHIRNFRSCKDVRLEGLGHVVGLVGRNGAGKTTILRAIEWAAAAALATDAFSRISAIDPREALAEPFIELELRGNEREYRYRIHRDFVEESRQGRPLRARDMEFLWVRTGGGWQEVFRREDDSVRVDEGPRDVEINRSTAAIAALRVLLPASDPLQVHLRAVTEVLRAVRYYPGHHTADFMEFHTEESGPISDDIYEIWVSAAALDGRIPSSLLVRLRFADEFRPEVFAELKGMMGPGGLGLLSDIRVVKLGDVEAHARRRQHRYFDVVFSVPGIEVELSLSQLSGGTRHALYLLLGLLFDESSTMLIEQPEDGIHPALLAKLVDLLRVNADPTQIMLASHSPAVLSSLRPADVRLVDIQAGVTRVRGLTDAEVQRAREYMEREGSLAEFLELIQED